jgi:hypothetical protein
MEVTRKMMKKTTQTLLLVFSTLLLLVSVSVSSQGQPATGSAQDRRRGSGETGSAQDRRSNNADFGGVWNTVTGNGKKIVIRLAQGRGYIVTGNYGVNGLTGSNRPMDRSVNAFVKVSAFTAEPVPQNQSWIRGTVTGNVLRFTWGEDGGQGAGRFTISSDGQSFEGTLSRTNNPDDTSGGTWNGTRLPNFAGAWQTSFGGSVLMMIFQQTDVRVSGQLNANSPELGVIRDGMVVDNTLRFTVLRRVPNVAHFVEQQVGIGELVMDAGGKSFKGTVLGVAVSGTLLSR